MRLYQIAVLILLNFSLGCSVRNPKVDFITLRSYLNVFMEEGKPNFKEVYDIEIAKSDKLTLFFVPAVHENIQSHLNGKTGEVVTDAPTYDTVVTCYVLENQGKYGIQYDSLKLENPKRFIRDSLLSNINFSRKHFEENSFISGKLTSSVKDNKTGNLRVAKYSSNDPERFDSTYHYLDYSMRNIELSIAPKLDSLYKSKVTKVAFINPPKIKDSLHYNREEISRALFRSEHPNAYHAENFIEKYWRDKKKILE